MRHCRDVVLEEDMCELCGNMNLKERPDFGLFYQLSVFDTDGECQTIQDKVANITSRRRRGECARRDKTGGMKKSILYTDTPNVVIMGLSAVPKGSIIRVSKLLSLPVLD